MKLKCEEKRQYVRVLLDIPCTFSSLDYKMSAADCKIVNMSLGGVAIETATEISIAENLKFDVLLPDEFKCEFFGQVVREIGDNMYGIKLMEISIDDRVKLGDFIMSQLEEQNYIIKKFLQRKEAEN